MTLVTVEITLVVTVPVDVDDPDDAMTRAEKDMQMALPDLRRELQAWGADDVAFGHVDALDTEEA